MSLKILCAGCSKDERALIEAGVRDGLRGSREPWTVSIVKFGRGWSVTLDGPAARGQRGSSFMIAGPAGPEAVADAVRSAAGGTGAPAAMSGPASAALGTMGPERREEHACAICGQRFVVVYEAEPDEPLEEAPVACPHCWKVGHVQVARSASVGRDYRADKL